MYWAWVAYGCHTHMFDLSFRSGIWFHEVNGLYRTLRVHNQIRGFLMFIICLFCLFLVLTLIILLISIVIILFSLILLYNCLWMPIHFLNYTKSIIGCSFIQWMPIHSLNYTKSIIHCFFIQWMPIPFLDYAKSIISCFLYSFIFTVSCSYRFNPFFLMYFFTGCKNGKILEW